MDTSQTLTGEREWAPAEGMMHSDMPTQSADKRCLTGELRLACVADKEVIKGRAQWWRLDMREKVDTHTCQDPGASSVMDGGGLVLSAWVAEG